MRGAAMSLTAAASGLVVFLLSLSVIQGQNGWTVIYTSTKICAIKGSTVDMSCIYSYPYTRNNFVTNTLWFTKVINKTPVDLETDSDYTGRVRHNCRNNRCTMTVTDVRLSDSAVYKFKFTTNQRGGRYTGQPGVTVSVTALSVQVIKAASYPRSHRVEIKCHSSCDLPGRPTYVWYNNGHKIQGQTSGCFSGDIPDLGSISCAVEGRETFPSPSVYPPKVPSVSVSPSAEIVEGRSVTLTCSSDSNPAATYTWYKDNEAPLRQSAVFVFKSIRRSDSGQYYCEAENDLGRRRSEYLHIDVKYPPKVPSVSVSPSAEIVEGSSVTLTCSSDSNPAANYTWYKKNEDSIKASGQIFTITDIRHEHSGNYSCEAQNTIGRENSTLQLVVVAESGISTAAGVTAAVLLLLLMLLCVYVWVRKMRANKEPPEPEENPDNREQFPPYQGQSEEQENLQYTTVRFSSAHTDPIYCNIRAAQPHTHEEEQEVTEYSVVRLNSDRTSPGSRHQETGERTVELYSTVLKT